MTMWHQPSFFGSSRSGHDRRGGDTTTIYDAPAVLEIVADVAWVIGGFCQDAPHGGGRRLGVGRALRQLCTKRRHDARYDGCSSRRPAVDCVDSRALEVSVARKVRLVPRQTARSDRGVAHAGLGHVDTGDTRHLGVRVRAFSTPRGRMATVGRSFSPRCAGTGCPT